MNASAVADGPGARPARPGGRAADRRAARRLLTRLTRRGGWWTPLLAAAALLSAAAQTALPAALGLAVDGALRGRGGGALAGCATLLAAFVVGDAVADLAAGASSARAAAWLRGELLRHVLAAGARVTRAFGPGDLVSRVVGGAADAGNAAAGAVWGVVALLPTVGSVVALALIDIWLAVAFAAALPLLTLALRAFVRDVASVVTRYQRAQGAIASLLTEALAGARTIAAAGTVERERARVLAPLGDLRRHGRAMWRAQTRMASQGALLLPLLEVVVLAVGGFELSAGRISAGQLLAAGRYTTLGAGIGVAVTSLGQLARAKAGARRAAEVLSLPAMGYGGASLPDGPGTLEFRQVTMYASGAGRSGPVLAGLDLLVPGGGSLAVVGASGQGKSLLAALAGRLADPDGGQVLLDGVPLPELSQHSLRAAIAYAFERPALLGETLADAIGFADEPPSRQRIVAAAKAASLDDFARRLPAGYDTPLAQAPMSGGEAQRVGLARAFAHGGRLLILDDATSSLDTVTELQVSEAITGAYRDRTRIIVAHRAATAARADLVAWLDGGQVRALGPHWRLWREAPGYRAVFAAGDDEGQAPRGDGPSDVRRAVGDGGTS